jgi:adenylate cyclase class IV
MLLIFFICSIALGTHLQSMTHKEIEYKIQLLSIEEHCNFEKRLQNNELAKAQETITQKDDYLVLDKHTWDQGKGYLYIPKTFRIRENSKKGCSICFKQSFDEEDQHSFRYEYETSIGNPEIFIKFLMHFIEEDIHYCSIEKTRTTYLIDGLEIACDQVKDLGNFIEIEVKKEVSSKEEGYALIEKFLKDMGIQKYKLFTQNYFIMRLNDCDFGVLKEL